MARKSLHHLWPIVWPSSSNTRICVDHFLPKWLIIVLATGLIGSCAVNVKQTARLFTMIKDHNHIISLPITSFVVAIICSLFMISTIALNIKISIHCHCHENLGGNLFHSEVGQHFIKSLPWKTFTCRGQLSLLHSEIWQPPDLPLLTPRCLCPDLLQVAVKKSLMIRQIFVFVVFSVGITLTKTVSYGKHL